MFKKNGVLLRQLIITAFMLTLCLFIIEGSKASASGTGSISGNVTSSDGMTPLQNILVKAYIWNGSGFWSWGTFFGPAANTDSNGDYHIGNLDSGIYRIEFIDWSNGKYIKQYYNNQSNLDSAQDIDISQGQAVTDINASLETAGHIQGTVTKDDGATPLQNVNVRAYKWNGAEWSEVIYYQAVTDINGNYDIGGLESGTFRVGFFHYLYATEYYDSQINLELASNIYVTAGEIVSDINVSLVLKGQIQGNVTEADGITPLQNILVKAYRWDGIGWSWMPFVGHYAITDSDGNYLISGLNSGAYRIEFDDWSEDNYLKEYYNNQTSLDLAEDINIDNEDIVTEINASLSRKVSSVVLTDATDATTIKSGSYVKVYGSQGINNITVESGAYAKLINFPGSNKIYIMGESSLFYVSRSGATITFNNPTDSTTLVIPATKTVQYIIFNDLNTTLIINNGKVLLGNQEITRNEALISLN